MLPKSDSYGGLVAFLSGWPNWLGDISVRPLFFGSQDFLCQTADDCIRLSDFLVNFCKMAS